MLKIVAVVLLTTNPDPFILIDTNSYSNIVDCEQHIETARMVITQKMGPALKSILSIKCVKPPEGA